MDGLVAKDVVIDHEPNLGREFLEEQAVGLRGHWAGIGVDWLGRGVCRGKKIDWRGTDLAIVNQIADSLLPSSAG